MSNTFDNATTQEPQPIQPAKPPKKKRRWPFVLAAPLAFFLGIAIGASGGDTATATAEAEPTPAKTVEVTVPGPTKTVKVPVPGPTVTVTAKPAGPSGSIPGDGVFLVGSDIKAGTYRAGNDSGNCYWARLSGTSGELGDILANDNPSGPALVTIRSSDKAFSSARCGEWTRVQ
ncbi:hypothetical protein [Actinopolymorpha rutila]|uniref:Uncharacterized protein n=1 Tax=Actinopolymorpha rutila TaxID=446787 RepID=A0A852Z415_9ACTN|nr:hypothetical protein [Actinopolymorpha rutila]NYH87714.1 hypothetical protein [Actinopolymorpha rutila]